jgi:hypothetical protein
VEAEQALPSPIEPIALAWLADLLADLESALAERAPTDDERARLRAELPQLRAAIAGWTDLLHRRASGDATDEVWTAARRLTGNMPAELDFGQGDAEADRPGVLPFVDRSSVPGKILFAQVSRAMQPDPFRDAVSTLGDVDQAELTRLEREERANADRAVASIDVCLRALGE